MLLRAQAEDAGHLQLNPVADTNLAAILPLLDRARDMPFTGLTQTTRSGMSQADTLGEIGRTTYREALQNDLLPRLLLRLEAQIGVTLDKPELCYEATRIYLMLGGAGPLDSGLVQDWMRRDWQSAFRGPGYDSVRNRLALHLEALLATPLPTAVLDGGLVERARAVFGRVSPAMRVYGRIRHSRAAAALPSWQPKEAMGPLGALLFVRQSGRSLDDGLPGFFTPAGFYGVYEPALAPTIQAVAAENWVVGGRTDMAGNTAQLAALEASVDALYQAEFFATWDGLLDDLQLTPMRSIAQTAQDLYGMTSPESPIRYFLAGVVRQVTLPLPDGVATVSGTVRQLASIQPVRAISAHYKPLQDLVGTGPGAPVDQALRSLTDVQQLLAKVAGSAINAPLPPPVGVDPIVTLRNDAQRWPSPLRRWLTTIAESAAAFRGQTAK